MATPEKLCNVQTLATATDTTSNDGRTPNKSIEDKYVTSEEKVKNSDPDRRRSKSGKRRSGFSRGRVSLTQLSKDAPSVDSEAFGADLYKQIPTDLSPAQRLSLLSRLALRHAIEAVDKEFENEAGFESFKAEALENVGATIDQMESDGTFEEACSTPSLAPNPINLQMNITVEELKSSIDRLQQESKAWDELVKTFETQAQQAKEQLSNLEMAYDCIPDDVKSMSSEFLPPPAEMPDLADMGLETANDIKKTSLLMNEYCHSVEVLNTVSCAARKHMDFLTDTLDHLSGCREKNLKNQIQEILGS